MKLKTCIKAILAFILIMPFISMALNGKTPQLLSEEQAFVMLFGNYDRIHKNAIWENIAFPTKKDKRDFWNKKTGIVSSVLFQPYKENGKEKIFLLTKTVPVGIPFECHACLPLLSAVVFAISNGHWGIKSQNLFLMYSGEYGVSPSAKLITVNKRKYGVLLEFEHRGDNLHKEQVLVVPRGNTIENVHI